MTRFAANVGFHDSSSSSTQESLQLASQKWPSILRAQKLYGGTVGSRRKWTAAKAPLTLVRKSHPALIGLNLAPLHIFELRKSIPLSHLSLFFSIIPRILKRAAKSQLSITPFFQYLEHSLWRTMRRYDHFTVPTYRDYPPLPQI